MTWRRWRGSVAVLALLLVASACTSDDEGGGPEGAGGDDGIGVEFGDDGPRASSILTYGETGDPGSPDYTDQVRRFAAGDWKEVRFTEGSIRRDPELTTQEVAG